MKYLEFLTKEELINAMQQVLPEDKLYEIVIDSLEKQKYLTLKELNILDEKVKKLDWSKLEAKEINKILEERDPLTKKFSDIISKVSEVRHMGYHRKHYPEDNRTYEELMKEEREKREAEVEKMMREYFEEMERKYG